MSSKIFKLSLVAVLIIAVIVSGFFYSSFKKRPTYTTAEVKKGDVQAFLNLNGTVRPQDEANLGFEMGGKIEKLSHAVGDFVKKGTVLAFSNSNSLEAQYQQAQDLVKSAKATKEQYEALLSKEKRQLKSLKSSDASSEDKNVQRAQIKASEAQVDSQEANLAAAIDNANSLKAQLDETIITAPFDGIISKQDVKVGEVAQSNVPIINLISQDTFKIEAFVSQTDVKTLNVGDSAKVTLDGNPLLAYGAKITAIDPAESEINNISNYKVTFNFSDSFSDLRSGVGANITVFTGQKNDAVIIPKDALFEQGGRKYVYISNAGMRQEKEVQAGIYGNDNMVEIVSGLNAGDTIFELSK